MLNKTDRALVLGWHPEPQYAGIFNEKELEEYCRCHRIFSDFFELNNIELVPNTPLYWAMIYSAIKHLQIGHTAADSGIQARAQIWMGANGWQILPPNQFCKLSHKDKVYTLPPHLSPERH